MRRRFERLRWRSPCAASLLVALLACGEAASEATEPEAAPVACAMVERRTLDDVRELFGIVDTPPGGRASVAAELAGRILLVHVREGDVVETGDPLAEVDGSNAEDAARAARAHLAEAEIATSNARATRDRAAHLVERGIAARRDLEDAESRLSEHEAALGALRATAREAGRTAGRARIVAPISGVVVRMIRHVGETVDGTPTTPIVELADLRTLELVATAAPHDLLALAIGQVGTLELDGLDEPLSLTVARIAPVLDPTAGTGTVRLALPARDAPLPLGLSGRATVHVGEHEALVVPGGAVRGRRDGGMEVLVCRDGVTAAVAVVVGRRDEELVEIVSGLVAGDRVVRRAIGIEEGAASIEAAESGSGAP